MVLHMQCPLNFENVQYIIKDESACNLSNTGKNFKDVLSIVNLVSKIFVRTDTSQNVKIHKTC